MRLLKTLLLTLAAFALVQNAARAHFIWATVQNNQARFALLENIAEAPSQDFENYVAHLSPRFNGKTITLDTSKNGARYADLPAGGGMVRAESIVGTKERGGEKYLLVYDAKGASALSFAGSTTQAPAEITARKSGDALVVSVRQNGKPVAANEVWVQWPGGPVPENGIKTNAGGEVSVLWPKDLPSGFVGIRAMVSDAKSGENAGLKYDSVHRWETLTFPVEEDAKDAKPFTQIIRASLGSSHEEVSTSAFNQTLFDGKLTKVQLETHLQQRALIHNELHRILIAADPALHIPYGAAQKNVLVLLFADLITMGSGWPTENQARPQTQAFLQEIRQSELRGPFFALGVQHVYFGGITNGGRMIGKQIGETLHFTPTYYEKSDGYAPYLLQVNQITDPAARREMIAGAQAAYRYIIASSNEDIFKAK